MSESKEKINVSTTFVSGIVQPLVVAVIVASAAAYVQVQVATATLEERISRVEQIQNERGEQFDLLIRLDERMLSILTQLEKMEERLNDIDRHQQKGSP